MIRVENLSKHYGSFTALSGISFAINKGKVAGLLGPNGAGKTTTLRILAGAQGASTGRVKLAGHDLEQEPILARRSLGYLPESAPLYPELRVGEHLEFRAALLGIPRRSVREAVTRVLTETHCRKVERVRILELSRGFRQRVGLADALLGTPPILLLDEPTAGLDPNEVREIRELIGGLRESRTVLLSTHALTEVESLCDRVLLMCQGRLIAEGTPEELKSEQNQPRLRVRAVDPEKKGLALLSNLDGVSVRSLSAESTDESEWLVMQNEPSACLDPLAERVSQTLASAGIWLRELSPQRVSLEEVMANLTQAPESEP